LYGTHRLLASASIAALSVAVTGLAFDAARLEKYPRFDRWSSGLLSGSIAGSKYQIDLSSRR
jgi:hypothetical protein